MDGTMTLAKESKSKPKLSDAERHKRFVDMAKEVEASEEQKDFDQAFTQVASKKEAHPKTGQNLSRQIPGAGHSEK